MVPIKERCRFNTERLRVDNWGKLVNSIEGREKLARQIISILNPEVTEHLPPAMKGVTTMYRAYQWIQERDEEGAVCLLHPRQDGNKIDILGFLFLVEFPDIERNKSELRVRFILDKEIWGRGLGSELIFGLVEWASKDEIVQVISGGVATSNMASIKIFEKFGFSSEQIGDIIFFKKRVE